MTSDASRTIVITGASDGIGAAAARQLSAAGHRIVVVGRSPDKTRSAAAAAGADASYVADFSDLAQVRDLAAELRDAYPRIDVLANNAGGVFPAGALSADGLPLTIQVNHLAPFLLTHELLDVLLESRAVVVNTASQAAMTGRVRPADLDGTRRRWSSFAAYSAAKLSNIIFTRGLHRRFSAQGLRTVAFHPGVVATSFGSTLGGVTALWYASGIGQRFMISAEQGGANLAHFAAGTPGVDWASGDYHDDHRQVARVPRQANDVRVVDAHWELSAQLLGLTR